MTSLYITRLAGGRLTLTPGVSKNWLAVENGRLVVKKNLSGGNAYLQSNRLVLKQPVEAGGVVTLSRIEPTSGVFTPVRVKAGKVTAKPPTFGGTSLVSTPQKIVPGKVRIMLPEWITSTQVYAIGQVDPADRLLAIRERRRTLFRRTLAGAFGPTEIRTRIYRSDAFGRPLELLEGITGASVEMSNYRDACWNLKLDIRRSFDFDPTREYVKVILETLVTDGRNYSEWVRSHLGLYRFRTPGGEYLRTHATWSLSGDSLETMILDNPLRGTYTAPVGAKLLESVKNILTGCGVPESMIDLPVNQEKTLTSAQTFDAFSSGEEDRNKLRVCNALLASGGFAALWCDERGRFTTQKLSEINRQRPKIRYAKDGEHLLLDGVGDERDDNRFANVVVVSSEDPAQDPPITVIVENNDPDSPGSYDQIGYWKMKEIKLKSVIDVQTAVEIGSAQLRAAGTYLQTTTYRTKPDPERRPRERAEMEVEQDASEPLSGIFDVTNWSMDIYPMPHEMAFTASRVRDVKEGWAS